jgi:cobalt/nickel transport system permease protein
VKTVFQEPYQAGDSLLHRLDPRVKVVVSLILITGIVLTPQRAWPAYPLLWALVSALAVAGGLGVWRVARGGALALPFTLAAATLLFTLPGRPIVTVLGLTISDAGLERFLSIVLKSWLAVQAALVLSMTTPFTDLLWAFSSLRVPGVLVAVISFMYRYLFTLRDEVERLIRARAARSGTIDGRQSGGSLFWRARVAGGMVGSLFLRSYERSERVYAAMLARGYTGQMRTPNPPPLTRRAVGRGAIPVLVLVMIEALAFLWWRG